MKPYIIKLERVIISNRVGQWCKIPYPNHPRGCPKYGQDASCPPMAKFIFDVSKPLYFVHSEFNLESHVFRMKKRNPHWSNLQCKCVLYWQGTSRKQMKERVKDAMWSLATNIFSDCPEGMGVNVYVTARLSGLKLERIRHLKTCRHISLLGTSFK